MNTDNADNTVNATATATAKPATATAKPATATAKPATATAKPATAKAKPAAEAAPARFNLATLPRVPGRAAAQVHEALRTAALAGLAPVDKADADRLATEAGRMAALAGEMGEGRASAKGGSEARAAWKASDVCQRAGLARHEATLAAGLALMGAAAAWRKATGR